MMRTLSSAGDGKLIWCCLRGVDEAAQTTDAHSSIDGLDGALELLAIHDVAPRRLARWKVALHLKAQAVQHRILPAKQLRRHSHPFPGIDPEDGWCL